eukprot:TRINITY_DN14442_c2_g1_i2.p1 TRINITY_DN14442_c2_g1~~TRINITY_DN14442_c2_g1_i2.p1  ORF type:complete len:272 (-),score=26.16 TRINITY_DN14442_c2_g1_i2:115-840(-)
MTIKATTLLIVRHGETDWNVNHIIQGQSKDDPPLNDLGVQQAWALMSKLQCKFQQNYFQLNGLNQNEQKCEIKQIFSSDLLRTKQTAEIMSEGLGLQINFVEGLRERHLGDLQGYTIQEARQNAPHALQALQTNDPLQEIPGGGESFCQFEQRVRNSIQKISDENEGEIVLVVTHGGPLGVIYQYVTNQNHKGKNVNCAINCIKIEGRNRAVVCWGDTEHLQNEGVNFQGCCGGGGGASGI